MTEEQMKTRIKEINIREEELRKERHEYERLLEIERRKLMEKNHKEFIGKCFVLDQSVACRHSYIKAFKILEVLNSPNENYAVCLSLIRGTRNNCFQEHGVQIETLPIWSYDVSRKMPFKDDPRMIDCYIGVSQDIFEERMLEHINIMKNYVDGE